MPAARLNIEILTRGRLPDDSRDLLILDCASHRCTHRHWTDQIGSSPEVSRFSLDLRAEDRIRKAVARSGFFALDSHVSSALDGDLVQVTVTSALRKNTVLSMNSVHRKLDRLVSQINECLPEAHRVSYGALTAGRSSRGR